MWSHGRMILTVRNRNTLRKKNVAVPHCPPQIPHWLTWDWAWNSMVRGRQQIAWEEQQSEKSIQKLHFRFKNNIDIHTVAILYIINKLATYICCCKYKSLLHTENKVIEISYFSCYNWTQHFLPRHFPCVPA